MGIVLNNGRMTELHPGNGFLINGHAFVYEKFENGTAIIRDTKKKNTIYCYGFEGLKHTVAQFGYDLKEV